ncbi:fucose-specific lectin [Jackrogersella minutella]|nr:fucose-specific lectin [Jackrogersella minutella]
MDIQSDSFDIKPGTALAAVYGAGEKRVYFQEQSGWIREATYDSTHGWRNGIEVVQLKDSSPIAVAYEGLNKFVYNGKEWKEGSLGQFHFEVSPSTNLAARYIDGEPRVYAQVVDTSIHEYKHANDEWNLAYNFGTGFNNTSIAAPATGKQQLFYQSTESIFIEKIDIGDGWQDGLYKYSNDESDTPIVAVTFGVDTHCVYHLNSEHYIVESVWNTGARDHKWTSQILSKKANPGSKLAGFAFTDGGNNANTNIQLYLQDEEGGENISEYAYKTGSGWTTNSAILPAK